MDESGDFCKKATECVCFIIVIIIYNYYYYYHYLETSIYRNTIKRQKYNSRLPEAIIKTAKNVVLGQALPGLLNKTKLRMIL